MTLQSLQSELLQAREQEHAAMWANASMREIEDRELAEWEQAQEPEMDDDPVVWCNRCSTWHSGIDCP